MERRYLERTNSSSSSTHSDDVSEFENSSDLESSDKAALVARLNTKLNAVNQKMSIVLENADNLNFKKSQVRALVREVLLQEKLSDF